MSEANTDKELETLAVLHEVVTIVSAYFSHNAMPASDLPGFITAVYESVTRLSTPIAAAEEKAPESPAVAVKRSVTKDFIVCLEDGKKFKSLRRHLSSFHNLTPEEYRAKWSLPSDYPMVAPSYSAVPSRLARDSGLGQMGKEENGEGIDANLDDEIADDGAVAAKVAATDPVDAEVHADADDQVAGAESDAAPVKKPGRGRPRKQA